MLNEEKIISDYKSGKTIVQIAKQEHVNMAAISDIIRPLGLPRAGNIRNIVNDPEFEEFFRNLYNSSDNVKFLWEELAKHPKLKGIKKKSIPKRFYEIRNYYGLTPKAEQIQYPNRYDRIRGYIIRNSKFSAKREGHEFNLKYTDFELPEYCPILGIKLEYGAGKQINGLAHASLDRIDNSKGYIPGNIMVVSRLANQMKNCASFEQLENFITNYKLLLDYKKEHGTLGNITDMLPHWKKLSLDS